MNYRGFRKTHEDDKSATLRHPKGHEIKISKDWLSEKDRSALKKLPIHAAEGADTGTDNSSDTDTSTSPAPGVNINIGADAQPGAAPVSVVPSDQQAPQQQQSPVAQAQPAPAAAPEAMPQSASPQVEQQAPIVPMGPAGKQAMATMPQAYQDAYNSAYNDSMAKHAQEDVAWQQDLHNGHVTPETYQSLFANKSTLGKIGTMFGLLVSGAGSGLSKQPNAVMKMMNNEIQNDLTAQTTSKQNANNFYIQALKQQELQGELPLWKAQTSEAQMRAKAAAIPLMNNAALHSLNQAAQKLSPNDPRRMQYEQALAQVAGQVSLQNYNVADVIAAQDARNQAFNIFGSQNQQQGQQNSEAGFQQQTKGLRFSGMQDIAKDMETKHVPDVGNASREVPADVLKEISTRQDLQNKIENLQQFAQQNSGSVDPEIINRGSAMAKTVQDKYRAANGQGVFKESEKNFVEGVLGSNPTQFFEKYRSGPGYQEASDANLGSLNTLKQSYGLPQSQPSGAQQSQGGTIEMLDPKSGRIVIVDQKTKTPLRWK